jgi:hypothetical protein
MVESDELKSDMVKSMSLFLVELRIRNGIQSIFDR